MATTERKHRPSSSARPPGARPSAPKKPEPTLIPLLEYPKKKERASEFLCKIKFRNDLPDLPCEPKFLKYPMDAQRFFRYRITSLEKNHVFQLHTETDLGVPINLIEPDAYECGDVVPSMAPEDEALLLDDDLSTRAKSPSSPMKEDIPWLRKTTYLSTDYSSELRGNTVDVTGRQSTKKRRTVDEEEVSREALTAQIEKSFQDATAEPKHPTNPELQPVEIMPLFPDVDLWANTYTHFVFDEVPAKGDKNQTLSDEILSRGLLLAGVREEKGRLQHLGYYLPKSEQESEVEEHKWVRQYCFQMRRDVELRTGVYFMRQTPEGMVYSPLNQRTHLRRVVQKEGVEDPVRKNLHLPVHTSVVAKFSSLSAAEEQERNATVAEALRGVKRSAPEPSSDHDNAASGGESD